jgi:hypothetical protein
MMTTRERVIYVRSGGRADVEIFVESCFEALGLVLGVAARFLVAGGRAVVAAMRGDR